MEGEKKIELTIGRIKKWQTRPMIGPTGRNIASLSLFVSNVQPKLINITDTRIITVTVKILSIGLSCRITCTLNSLVSISHSVPIKKSSIVNNN